LGDKSLSNENNLDNIRRKVKLTDQTQLYQIKDKSGQVINFEEASGREIFNHYRHNMTNYDQVLDEVRAEQGYVSGRQEKKATAGAAEQILKKYHDEHVKVIQDSQKKGNTLKIVMGKVGVATASALTSKLDEWSEKIKTVSKLENSQESLRAWNDTYRVQRDLVKLMLVQENSQQETIDKINIIYGTRSVNKAIDNGCTLLNLEKSEILKLLKKSIKYSQSKKL
jgi:hypothetical protein